jgi:hypothetical protein
MKTVLYKDLEVGDLFAFKTEPSTKCRKAGDQTYDYFKNGKWINGFNHSADISNWEFIDIRESSNKVTHNCRFCKDTGMVTLFSTSKPCLDCPKEEFIFELPEGLVFIQDEDGDGIICAQCGELVDIRTDGYECCGCELIFYVEIPNSCSFNCQEQVVPSLNLSEGNFFCLGCEKYFK